jgi:hypothetical protein
MSTDVSEVRAATIRAMMEAARTSETSVNIQLRTWQYIPEDSELHTRRHENLKSHTGTLKFSPPMWSVTDVMRVNNLTKNNNSTYKLKDFTAI